ncbi:MAG: GtrA family protein [Chloroflexota bacterium]
MTAIITGVSERFGIKPREAERFVKFLIVGMTGFVVDFTIFNLLIGPIGVWVSPDHWLYNLLTGFGLSGDFVISLAPTLAAIVSFIMAVCNNFIWNRHWTYPDSRSKSRRKQFTMFLTVSLIGIMIRIPLITVLNPIFKSIFKAIPLVAPYANRLAANAALAIAVLVVLFWNFFINRFWTYNDVE